MSNTIKLAKQMEGRANYLTQAWRRSRLFKQEVGFKALKFD